MIKDEETGETKRVEVPRLLRRWWWQDETGAVLLELRYGNKPIAVVDNKSTIEVGPMDKLPKVIDMVIEAVSAGELDALRHTSAPPSGSPEATPTSADIRLVTCCKPS